jgi:hypothetical protein
MFTVTQYQDGYEATPVQTHNAETYREAYTWAYDWAKGFAREIGGYYKCERSDQTWLDRFDVHARSYSALEDDPRRYHIEIACDDLTAWQALVVERGSVWKA